MKRCAFLATPLLLLLTAVNPALAVDVSGSVAATSDYVFRGVSQTDESPALQVGLRLDTEAGFYGALWASNVEYGATLGTDAEIDYTLGWVGEIGTDWALDANLTRYTYPGTRSGFQLDYSELIGTITWKQRGYAVLGYSNDVFASGHDGTWVQIGTRLPLAEAWTLDASVAHYQLEDALADSYQYASLGVVWTRRAFSVRGTGHLTSDSAESMFGDVAKPRLEIAAAWTF